MFDTLCLIGFTIMLATGQMLFKSAGLLMRDRPFQEGVLAVATAPTFYLALVLYGAATALWIWILSRVQLSVAYPWVGAGVLIVPCLSYFIYGDRVNGYYWLGAVFIVIGIVLTQMGGSRT